MTRTITAEEEERMWDAVRREFPDDKMMQEIHFIRMKMQAERENINLAEKIQLYSGGRDRNQEEIRRSSTTARIKIYLDTTVPSAYFDARTPERREFTVEFWDNVMPDYEAFISELVLDEIRKTPDYVKKQQLFKLVAKLEMVPIEETAVALAQSYLQAGIFTSAAANDARHTAIAVTNGIGYIISWNYRHLVKTRTRDRLNDFNAQHGWPGIQIITPPDL